MGQGVRYACGSVDVFFRPSFFFPEHCPIPRTKDTHRYKCFQFFTQVPIVLGFAKFQSMALALCRVPLAVL